jgi:hypothetical protein
LGRSGGKEEVSHGGLGHGVQAKGVWGLGILNTRNMNITLMLRWIWKLYQGAEGIWVDLLKTKYLGDRDIFASETPSKGS